MGIRNWLILVLVGIVLGVGVYLYFFVFQNGLGKPGTTFNTSAPAVLKQVQELNRLETAQFNIQKIIEAGQTGNMFQNLLYGDKILLVADGEVIAGFDLADLPSESVSVSGNELTIKMPAPQILVLHLNSENTRVYDRTTGLFSKGDKDLETLARQKAESEIRLAACEAGILQTAADNAQKQLKVLFSGMGYSSIKIVVASGSC